MSQQSSKKDRRDSSRQARVQAARARARAKKQKRVALIVLLAMLAGSGGFFYLQGKSGAEAELEQARAAAGCTDIKEVEELPVGDHIPPGSPDPTYNSNPPTSGPHEGNTAEWGLSDEKVPDRNSVHNLEHGGVIVHYQADKVGEKALEEVQDYVDVIDVDPTGQTGLILQPSPDIKDNVAIASWGHLQTCKDLSLRVIKAYVRKECGKGPEPFTCAPGAK